LKIFYKAVEAKNLKGCLEEIAGMNLNHFFGE
jgi:hypothetical protein